MTRRTLFSALFAAPAAAQFQTKEETEREFYRLINDFIIAWNRVVENALKGTWDYKMAEACDKAYSKLATHPMWLTHKGK